MTDWKQIKKDVLEGYGEQFKLHTDLMGHSPQQAKDFIIMSMLSDVQEEMQHNKEQALMMVNHIKIILADAHKPSDARE